MVPMSMYEQSGSLSEVHIFGELTSPALRPTSSHDRGCRSRRNGKINPLHLYKDSLSNQEHKSSSHVTEDIVLDSDSRSGMLVQVPKLYVPEF